MGSLADSAAAPQQARCSKKPELIDFLTVRGVMSSSALVSDIPFLPTSRLAPPHLLTPHSECTPVPPPPLPPLTPHHSPPSPLSTTTTLHHAGEWKYQLAPVRSAGVRVRCR
ncbi:unnamed protein product [Pleuronectes platessa]|uniref:Uncharacterized protein n=1 Tax=Pleuronectes platessa TaxID=8262 RepID=A0A9N7W2T3_PLEPL|nr:unnamed protein product [Pleuronectes platessa]